MGYWELMAKLTILMYCVIAYTFGLPDRGTGLVAANGVTGSATLLVLLLLIYVSLNMAFHLVSNKNLGKVLLACTILLSLLGFAYVHLLFILLLPINIFELLPVHGTSKWLPLGVCALPLLLLDKGIWAEYFLVAGFCYVLCLLASRYRDQGNRLEEENRQLRERAHYLAGRLEIDSEYRRQMQYSSQLEERNKIAQEIHDRVGHAIAGSVIQLEAARLLVTRDTEQAGEILQKVITTLRDGMESIRATLRNIKPAPQQLGINRLKLLLDEFTANQQIRTSLLHQGNLETIAQIQWKVIYDNAGEALTNTLKYSGATAVTINVEVLHSLIKAEIKDNGAGACSINKGMGIRGMEERSGSLGGKVIVDGSRGFSVITLLPIEEDTSEYKTVDC